MMSMQEAMRARHTVRRYLDRPLRPDIVEKLNSRLAQLNAKHDLAMKLVVNDTRAFNALLKMVLAKGVKNYVILAGKNGPGLDERLGYCSADFMLYAQALGLNTWWVGGTFSRKAVSEIADAARMIGIVAVGYGATQGVPHKSKRPEEVSFYQGEEPQWFRDGVEAALLAPTAMNRQAFYITGEENKVKITYDDGLFTGAFRGADLGLVKYHFELGAGADNFVWANE